MAILRVVMTIINIIMILIFLTKTDRDTATGALAIEIVFICNIILIWN